MVEVQTEFGPDFFELWILGFFYMAIFQTCDVDAKAKQMETHKMSKAHMLRTLEI